MGKMLVCTVAGQTWQHISWVPQAYRGLKKGSDELRQEKSLQHHCTAALAGEALAGKPRYTSAFPRVPTSASDRTRPLLCLHLLLGVIPTSRSSPAWFLNPEMKARHQRSCWRVHATQVAQKGTASTKPPSNHGSKIKDKIYIQQIYKTWLQPKWLLLTPLPTRISLWRRYLLDVTSLSHSQTTHRFCCHVNVNPDFPCGQQKHIRGNTHSTYHALSTSRTSPGDVVNPTRGTATLAVT